MPLKKAGTCEHVQTGTGGKAGAIERICVAVFFKRESEAELVDEPGCEDVVEAAGEDAVPGVGGAVGQGKIGGLDLVVVFEGVSSEDGGFGPEVLVAAKIELVGLDVVAPGAEIVVPLIGDGGLERQVGVDVWVWIELKELCGARVDGHDVTGVGGAGLEGIVERRGRFLREVAALHQDGGNLGLKDVRLREA